MSREELTKLQAAMIIAVLVCAAVIGLSACWVTRRKPAPPPPGPAEVELVNLTRTKTIIEVEAEGRVLHLRNESFWLEDQFSRILEHRAEFTLSLIERLNESLSTYGERGEYAVNVSVEFNETRRSTILKCNVLSAISKSGSRYHATFRWLLRPLGLDFIDSEFEHPENGLYWEGSISGVPTTVTLWFPISVPAWGQPNGHCHAHVWWET